MSLLSVYVEGAVDESAQGVRTLAASIAARYGLSAADLEKRLVSGRFRVKANVDAATARAFATDLESLGARCAILEADERARGESRGVEVRGEPRTTDERAAQPPRGVRGIPALESPRAPPSPTAERLPASARGVPPRTATPARGARPLDGTAARTATPATSVPRATTPPRSNLIDQIPARALTPIKSLAPLEARTATPATSVPRVPTLDTTRPLEEDLDEVLGIEPPPSASRPAGPMARTISSPAVPPVAAATSSAPVAPVAPGAPSPPVAPIVRYADDPLALHSPTLRGLAAVDRERLPDYSASHAPTLRGLSASERAELIRSAGDAAQALRAPPDDPFAPFAADPFAPFAADPAALHPPTVRELSAADRARTPAHALPAMPAASRTATLTHAGLPSRPAAASPPAPTGLAAALAGGSYGSGGLGALDGATFSLSTLDGQDDREPSGGGSPFAPPPPPPAYEPSTLPPDSRRTAAYDTASDDELPYGAAALAAMPALTPIGSLEAMAPPLPPPSQDQRISSVFTAPAPPSFEAARRPRPSADPANRFSAPEEEAPLQLNLADDPRPRRGSLSRDGFPEGAPMMTPAIAPAPAVGSGASVTAAHERTQRLRLVLAAGVLASVLLAFLPAHFFAKGRERDAFERIDNRVRIAQSEITSVAEWTALDDVRTALLRQKAAAKQEIAILSILLWVGLAGAASLAWARFGVPRFDPGTFD